MLINKDKQTEQKGKKQVINLETSHEAIRETLHLLSVGNFFEVIQQNSEIGKSAIGPNKAPFWKKVSLVFRTTYHYTYSR